MLNLSRIQVELERAKEKLRNVEETIQKVEGKTFSNGPVRYGGPKTEFYSEKTRNVSALDDTKNPRKRLSASNVDSRNQRLPTTDTLFGLKRVIREKREVGSSFKRPGGEARPQGVFARLSGGPYHQADEEDEDDFGKKPTLPSRVFATATEVPSRQEVIAAQAQDEQSKERNKRMFGALVGTLQKFRKEETRVREREEKRKKVEKKLEEDAKREKEKLMQEKRELFLEKKRREVEIKRIEWSLNRVKEYEAWEADVIPLKNFIQTQAKPHIFYLPSAHNAKTLERLEHSQKLVERMIEKRKTNLKEEIENSEKKARKAAAEGAEVEEAENIPEDNEDNSNTEQQVQLAYESKNTGNGFFGEEQQETKSPKPDDDGKDDFNEKLETENWDKTEKEETKESTNISQDEEKTSETEKPGNKNVVSDTWSSTNKEINNEERLNVEKSFLDEGLDKKEENLDNLDGEKSNQTDSEYKSMNLENSDVESSNLNYVAKVPCQETDKTEQETVDIDAVKPNENVAESPEKTNDMKPLSESEQQTEEKANELLDEKNKRAKRSREKSPSKKTGRRSRSLKRSRSPRGSSRSKRRRSSSRQRKARKQSSSNSPPRKSRRSKSPLPRRGQRNFSSKKRSPNTRSGRRSESRTSSSASPRKKRSRSFSSSSKSD